MAFLWWVERPDVFWHFGLERSLIFAVISRKELEFFHLYPIIDQGEEVLVLGDELVAKVGVVEELDGQGLVGQLLQQVLVVGVEGVENLRTQKEQIVSRD